MDNLVFWVYLITRIEVLKDFFTFLTVLFVVLSLSSSIRWAAIQDKSHKDEADYAAISRTKKWLAGFIVLVVISVCINSLIPTKKDSLTIAGAYLAVEVARSAPAQRIGSGTLSIVEKFLQKQALLLDRDIQELKSNNRKKSEQPVEEESLEKSSEDELVDTLRDAALKSATEVVKEKVK